MTHVDPAEQFLTAQLQQAGAQVGGEVLVVGGEQDRLVVPRGESPDQVAYPVQATTVLPVPGPPPTRAGPL